MDILRLLLNKIKAFLEKLTPNQRMLLSAGVTALLIGLGFLLFQSPQLAYVPLYTDLDPVDAAKVVETLESTNIPYQLARGGTAVLVPADRAERLRLSFAAQGLPKTGIIGYEIFDKVNLGMTDFIQKVNFRRALEGELTKTIESLEEVSSARVHIVKPEPSLFIEKEKLTTASIMLKLRSSISRLTREQIHGITYLVATSVEGLTPENITIVDDSGKMLSDKKPEDTAIGLSQQQLELQKGVESYLEKKAQTMLDEMIGQGKSIVKISAALNFKKVDSTLEQFDPERTTLR
ncbi:MAG: flagellar M-ring protein FliF, partial [Candidatus Latescibacteria bacterium]|nr:flagellar M-ring protein FliF [Candidatus Latescibacterota bacterium]